MRIAQIRNRDISNGEGIRVSLFTSGCSHRCPGCFNPEYQDFSYGDLMTEAILEEVVEDLKESYISGLTLLGGEPLENPDLAQWLGPLRQTMDGMNAKRGPHDLEKTIWIYSGDTFEKIVEDPMKKEALALCDVLVDGPFVEDLLDLKLRFRGSSNQRILDVKASLDMGEPVLVEAYAEVT